MPQPRLWPLLGALGALACATARPPPPLPPPRPPAHPSGVVVPAYDPDAVETVVPAVARVPRRFEEDSPPPPRHHHERLLTPRQYRRLVHRYPLGFGPAECRELCRDPAEFEPAGRWTWVLRCQLSRTFEGAPSVACHEDAVGADELERIRARWRLPPVSPPAGGRSASAGAR